jgi:hypothetical protein
VSDSNYFFQHKTISIINSNLCWLRAQILKPNDLGANPGSPITVSSVTLGKLFNLSENKLLFSIICKMEQYYYPPPSVVVRMNTGKALTAQQNVSNF